MESTDPPNIAPAPPSPGIEAARRAFARGDFVAARAALRSVDPGGLPPDAGAERQRLARALRFDPVIAAVASGLVAVWVVVFLVGTG